MNKQNFTQIVKNYSHITAEERNKLQEIASDFPYSQIIHTLIAKANADARTPIANQTLGYAALYATDRAVLRGIIKPDSTATPQKRATTPSPQAAVQKTEVVSKPIAEKASADEKADEKSEIKKDKRITVNRDLMDQGDFHLRETIMEDLLALKESKASYMAWVDLPDEKETTKSSKPKKTAPAKPAKKVSKKKAKEGVAALSKPEEKKTKKKATTQKVTAKRSSKTSVQAKAKKKEAQSAPKKGTKKKSSLKKNEADQSVIIDDFISKEPSITSKASRKSQANQEDLSQPSTKFTEDLMSENLAKIMISQGKTDKAIDIYKKLIWKFPQKKAYFATQIEELKK